MVCEAVAFQRDGALPGGSASPANEGKQYSGQRPASERLLAAALFLLQITSTVLIGQRSKLSKFATY